jgi:hypothetical protein
MADHAQLRDQLWTDLAVEPKPLTLERVREIARRSLPPKEGSDFDAWLAKHGGRLLERLNNG